MQGEEADINRRSSLWPSTPLPCRGDVTIPATQVYNRAAASENRSPKNNDLVVRVISRILLAASFVFVSSLSPTCALAQRGVGITIKDTANGVEIVALQPGGPADLYSSDNSPHVGDFIIEAMGSPAPNTKSVVDAITRAGENLDSAFLKVRRKDHTLYTSVPIVELDDLIPYESAPPQLRSATRGSYLLDMRKFTKSICISWDSLSNAFGYRIRKKISVPVGSQVAGIFEIVGPPYLQQFFTHEKVLIIDGWSPGEFMKFDIPIDAANVIYLDKDGQKTQSEGLKGCSTSNSCLAVVIAEVGYDDYGRWVGPKYGGPVCDGVGNGAGFFLKAERIFLLGHTSSDYSNKLMWAKVGNILQLLKAIYDIL